MKDLLRIFGNITRIKILSCLLDEGRDVSDLIGRCQLSQSSVSQHLKKLKDAGLITCETNGKQRIYQLKNKKVGKVSKELLKLIN